MLNYYEIKKALSETNLPDGTYTIFGRDLSLTYVKSGYQVSWERPDDNYSESDYNDLVNRLEAKYGEVFIGVWEGAVETSFNVSDLEQALELGRQFNQDAIWDWAKSEAIYLKEGK